LDSIFSFKCDQLWSCFAVVEAAGLCEGDAVVHVVQAAQVRDVQGPGPPQAGEPKAGEPIDHCEYRRPHDEHSNNFLSSALSL
jgi:hypothetical protein